MAKWCTSCGAVRWTVLFLVVASSLGQTVESEENFEETPFATESTNEYPETTTDPTTPNTEAPEGPRRSERMVVVFVKADPKADTKNITEFLDSDDVVYTTGENETIVITDTESSDDEILHDDGDLMVMAGRSLNDNLNEKLLSEAESRKQENPLNREVKLKNVLNKWNTDIDFNLSDLLKMNLASLLADDYEEMNRLMNQNLVKDDTNGFMEGTITDSLEPRDADNGILDMDQTVAASSEVVRQVLPVPTSTSPRSILRSSGQTVPQYTYPHYSPAPPSVLPTGNALGLPMPTRSFPRTVARPAQASTVPPPRLIRHPQNHTTPRSPTRFGERLVGRLPRPFQYMINMTVGGRQTTTEKPFVRSSIVSYLPAASQSYPARQRAPHPYFQRPTTRNNMPSPTRIQGSTTESRLTKTRVTTAALTSKEFGARIRPFQYMRERNSTNTTQNGNENKKKVNREVKINHLRSNLVGKLVVMQSILDKKQEKSGSVVTLASTQLNRKGLPYGILKPIVPLRPRINFETRTTSLTQTTKVSIPVTPPELGLKDKKKYRRPPSFRKGGSYKLSAEKQTEEDVTSNPAKLRESMVILRAEETTALSSIANTTENSVQSSDVYDQRTLPLPVTVMSDVNETSTKITNTTDTTTASTENNTTAFEHEIASKSVDTSLAANTTESISGLQESTSQSATETAMPTENVYNDEQSASPFTLKQVDTLLAHLDLHGSPTTTIEDTKETAIQNDKITTPLSSLEIVDTSTSNVNLQGTTATVENTTETAIQNDKPTTSSSILKVVGISEATVDLQETTTEETKETTRDSQSINTDEQKIQTTIPEIAFTLFQDTKLSAETATQSLLTARASTDAPVKHTSMTAIIEGASSVEENKASSGKHKSVSDDDSLNDDEDRLDDKGDDESDFDFLDEESERVVETNDERLSTDNKLSRFDRSVGSVSKEQSKTAEVLIIPPSDENIFSALDLARGVMRPINLPYNILPTGEVTTTR